MLSYNLPLKKSVKKIGKVFGKLLLIIGAASILIVLIGHSRRWYREAVWLYYSKINPRAGAKRLEVVYKQLFDEAENTRDQANLLISEMQVQVSDINSLFRYQEKLRGLFSQREAIFQEILRIDGKAKSLNISQNYREFFQKRQLADQNEYEAFRIYRRGMENIMEGTLAYLKFEKFYRQAFALISAFVLSPEESFTGENLETFKTLTSNLELQFREIISLQKEKVYPEKLVEDMRDKKEIVQLFQKANEAILAEDEEKTEKTLNTISQRIKQREEKGVNYEDLKLQWVEEINKPLFEAQDKKHKKSLDLYNQAYIYAKTQNLKEILSVWNGEPPGEIKENLKGT